MKGNGTRSPDAIIADIQAIRSEMDSTLLAIEERLTPGQMIDQGLDYLRNSGGREYLANLGTSVKTNPLPATLVGIGLAWLMVTQQRTSRPGLTGRVEYEHAGIRTAPGEYPADSRATSGTSLGEKVGEAKAQVGAMADRASEAAAAARDKVAGAMQSARDAAADTARRARDVYARGADTARVQMDRVSSGYRQLVQEQPLALGAIGLGVGALLAALAPRTRREDAMMGSTADAVKQNAVEAGREQLIRAGDKVRSTLDHAREASSEARTTSAADMQRSDSAARAVTTPPAASGSSPSAGGDPAGPTRVRAGGPLDE